MGRKELWSDLGFGKVTLAEEQGVVLRDKNGGEEAGSEAAAAIRSGGGGWSWDSGHRVEGRGGL